MKKLCSFLSFAILTASPLLSQSLNATSSAGLLARVEARYPFPEGSKGESAVFDIIEQNIDGTRAEIERLDFSDSAGMHSFSQVLRLSVPGRSSDTLAVAIPVSHPAGAAHSASGAIGIAAAIEAANAFMEDPPAVSVDFLFLGAERRREAAGPLGSRRILEQLDVQLPEALVYFDVPGAGEWTEYTQAPTPGSEVVTETRTLLPGLSGNITIQRGLPQRNEPALSVVTGAPGKVAPEWLADAVREAAGGADVPARIDDSATQLFRIGAAPPGRSFLIDGWLEADVPSVLVVDTESRYDARLDRFDRAAETTRPYNGPERVAAAQSLTATIRNLPVQFSEGIPGEWDRHAIAFSVGGYRLVLDESAYLLLFLSVVGLTVFYGTIFRKPLARYIRTIRRNFWTIPLLFAAAFVYLGVSGALVDATLDIREVGNLFNYRPVETFALKVFLARGLFQLTYLVAGRLPLTSNGSFYSAAALFLVFISILIFATINIALSVYFLFGFLGVFLVSITRFRLLKLAWMFLSFIPLFIAAWIVFSQKAEGIIQLLIVDWRGDLLLAAAVLPTLLLIIRMGFLFSHPRKGRGHFVGAVATTSFLITAAVLAARLLTFPVFTPEQPQTVRLEEFVGEDDDSPRTEITSDAPLPSVFVGGQIFEPEVGEHSATFGRVEREEPFVTVTEVEREAFLGRTRYRLALESTRTLRAVDGEFRGSRPLFLYSLNFPFSPIEDGRRQKVHIGRNPPNPLFLDVVIPDGVDVELVYEVELPGPQTYVPGAGDSVRVFSRRIEQGVFPLAGSVQ